MQVGVKGAIGVVLIGELKTFAEWTLGESFSPQFQVEGSTRFEYGAAAQAKIFGAAEWTWTYID